MNSYPPKPEQATLYYHHYGYEIPVALGAWEWSVDFGRWGRIVTFADGWHGYTFPLWNRLRRIFTITHEHRKAARRIRVCQHRKVTFRFRSTLPALS